MPVIHLEHRRWRFENPGQPKLQHSACTSASQLTCVSHPADIDLHTGFTWLGTGAFAPKSLSARFLNQQSAAPVGLTQDQALVGDMFFALWQNAHPEQMPNVLVPIDVEGGEVGWSRGEGVDQWKVVYANVVSGDWRMCG